MLHSVLNMIEVFLISTRNLLALIYLLKIIKMFQGAP